MLSLAVLMLATQLAGGTVSAHTLAGRKVWVYTPADYTASKEYGLLVLLDGDAYLEDMPAPPILDELHANVVAVFVDNSANRLGDLANHQQFADFLARDLVPAVRAKWHVSKDPKHAVIGGYSAGGLGAAYAAFRHPEVFGNVLSQSGAFWRGNEGASMPGEWLTDAFRKSPRLGIRFYIDIGADETHPAANGVIFIDANRHLRDALRAAGYTVEYVEVPHAKHDPQHWKASLPAALRYVLTPP